LTAFRDAAWLDGPRVRGYSAAIALTLAAVLIANVALSRNFIGVGNEPIGTDFVSFWTAGSLARGGSPQAVYSREILEAAERALSGGQGYYAFFYPPAFLLICLPLALLSYPWALAVWLAATGYAYWRVLRVLLPQREAIFPILGFPAFFINAGFGQNGFLTAALLGSGALLLPRRPVLAGLCWGALIIKPQLGILIPAVLIAARAWRAMAAAFCSAAALAGASWVAFGTETWRAFFASSGLARAALEQGEMGFHKLQSVYGGLRLAGFGVASAYAIQAILALLMAGGLIWVARRSQSAVAPAVALPAATVLASPFLLTYDLAMLGFPMAWLAAEGLASGFGPWEKSVLALCYLIPLLAHTNAHEWLYIPWAPLISALLLLMVARRALSWRAQPA
jgi:hypothetical protein